MEEKKYIAEFDIEQVVVLKTDPEKLERICTGISIRKNGISYELAFAEKSTWHYGFEIESAPTKTVIGFR